LRVSRGVHTNNWNCGGRKYAKGTPLGRAAFLLARIGVACAHEERIRDAQIVRGESQVFSDGGGVVISLLLVVLMGLTFSTRLQAQGPALTTISGTVNRADGTAASATVLISWPSFQTAAGDAVTTRWIYRAAGPQPGSVSRGNVPRCGARIG
jgi:hypothetical protein